MHYEINVSQHGQHLFATHDRSCRDEFSAAKVYAMLVARFPHSEGFAVSCTLWEARGNGIAHGYLIEKAAGVS